MPLCKLPSSNPNRPPEPVLVDPVVDLTSRRQLNSLNSPFGSAQLDSRISTRDRGTWIAGTGTPGVHSGVEKKKKKMHGQTGAQDHFWPFALVPAPPRCPDGADLDFWPVQRSVQCSRRPPRETVLPGGRRQTGPAPTLRVPNFGPVPQGRHEEPRTLFPLFDHSIAFSRRGALVLFHLVPLLGVWWVLILHAGLDGP